MRSLGEPVSPGVGRTGETNKKQTDLAGDLFETAIQTIPKDLCITFTTLGTLRATITRLYQAHKEATVRLLLTGITGLHRYCDQSAPVSSLHTRMVPPRCGFRNPKDNARVSARSHK